MKHQVIASLDPGPDLSKPDKFFVPSTLLEPRQLEAVKMQLAAEQRREYYDDGDDELLPNMCPKIKEETLKVTRKWAEIYKEEHRVHEMFENETLYKPNHVFVGFPVHFSTWDVSEIKDSLLQIDKYSKLLEHAKDEDTFVVACKSYPIEAKLLSVWLFFGLMTPRFNPAHVIQGDYHENRGTFINPTEREELML
eukprot:Platyproteum_vivax@DN260_c0_g1_i1.p1